MNLQGAIKSAFNVADIVWQSYVGDLSDDDLMVRPVPGANHIKWQLGHLIAAEASFNSLIAGANAVPLPAGFKEQYTTETASSDDPTKFHSKEELLKLAAEQRAVTLAAIATVTEADLDQPTPEHMQSYCATIGDMVLLIPAHWTMHSGQWAVIRRKLGRAPLF